MTIDEALEELDGIYHYCEEIEIPCNTDAILLGIEALKVIGQFRKGEWTLVGATLPGETKENS